MTSPRLQYVKQCYGWRCWYCPRLATTVDHYRPKSRGGSGSIENLRPCCGPCNEAKADIPPSEWHRTRQRERPWERN